MGLRSRNVSITEASRPVLPRHAKLKFDETRQRWVILAPERVLAPDDIAVEILQLCDGARSVADMIDQLAEKYGGKNLAPRRGCRRRRGHDGPARKKIARAARANRNRLHRHAAGSCGQGFPDGSARGEAGGNPDMSPPLTDATPLPADPAD